MMQVEQSPAKNLLSLTTPVAFGYIPLGIAFGILFQEMGYGWYWPGVMGLVVFAGSAQFMVIALMKAQAGLAEIFLVTLLLNLRHIFYGLSFVQRYAKLGLAKVYLIFGLTDETYSLLTTLPEPSQTHRLKYYLSVTSLNHMYWVLGCALGGVFGELVAIRMEGLDFALTALFIVLAVEQYDSKKRMDLVVFAGLSGLVAQILFAGSMLVIAMVICVSFLIWEGCRKKWIVEQTSSP